jgi:hypothetical protein
MRALPTGTVNFTSRDPIGFCTSSAWAKERDRLSGPVLEHEGPEFEQGRESGRKLSLDEIVQVTLAGR